MKAGVIGCGSIGARYAVWLRDLGLDVGVHDSDPRRLQPFTDCGAIHSFNHVGDLLAWKPECVIVSTPPRHHREATVAALATGARVLVEKPISHDLDSAQKMLEAARASAGSLFVVCNMRFHPGPSTLHANLSVIGEPLFARASFGHRLSQMRPPGAEIYASKVAEGGGVILDCIHEIDYLQWIFGRVSGVNSQVARIGSEVIEAEDYAEVNLVFYSGVRVSLHLDFLARWKRRGAELVGGDAALIWMSEGKSPEHCHVWSADRSGRRILLDCPDVDPSGSYKSMLRAFVEGDESLQTAEQGFESLRVALEARAA